jgi:hypothetical protein
MFLLLSFIQSILSECLLCASPGLDRDEDTAVTRVSQACFLESHSLVREIEPTSMARAGSGKSKDGGNPDRTCGPSPGWSGMAASRNLTYK